MFLFFDATQSLSGYIILNKNLEIEEFSGQVNLILRKEQLDKNQHISELIEKLKNKIRQFFEEEVLTALKSKSIHNLVFNRKKSQLILSITPLNSGNTILSFQEFSQSQKIVEKTLPEKLNEILIRVDRNLQIVYVSGNFNKAFAYNSTNILLKTINESQLFGDNSEYISKLVLSTFHNHERKSAELVIPKNESHNWWKLDRKSTRLNSSHT